LNNTARRRQSRAEPPICVAGIFDLPAHDVVQNRPIWPATVSREFVYGTTMVSDVELFAATPVIVAGW
jgi:hypothetical protein